MSRRVHAGVVGLALLLAGCDSGGAERTCAGAGGAELCLTPKGDAYELSATGFQPGSELYLAADGQGDRAIAVDPEGGIATGGIVQVLGEDGPERPERVTVHGTTRDGQPVTFEVVP
jgi:hypothetical protein